jgi:hypothetical protein
MSPAQQGGDTAMKEQGTGIEGESRSLWHHLEEFVRGHIQQFVQRLLVEEVTVRLGRAKSERRAAVDASEGYRNGYGKPRNLTMSCGTITVQRPRVRGLAVGSRVRSLLLLLTWDKQKGSEGKKKGTFYFSNQSAADLGGRRPASSRSRRAVRRTHASLPNGVPGSHCADVPRLLRRSLVR